MEFYRMCLNTASCQHRAYHYWNIVISYYASQLVHRGEYSILLLNDESTIMTRFSWQSPIRRDTTSIARTYNENREYYIDQRTYKIFRWSYIAIYSPFKIYLSTSLISDRETTRKTRSEFDRCRHGGCSLQTGQLRPRHRSRQKFAPRRECSRASTPSRFGQPLANDIFMRDGHHDYPYSRIIFLFPSDYIAIYS